ncbi:DMT family transporter [Roseinatronobacter sp. NSM]|uniref:DMT family transporter n=1 Tax=Roseinatronobacter sp. NSM TaxID=3457785 RepID=UPI00403502BC
MNDHLKGLLITGLGVLFIVPDSLFVRLIDADGLTIAFWRNLTSGAFIMLFVLATQGRSAVASVLCSGSAGLTYVVFFGTSATGFVLAVTLTSVANVVFIIATMPVFAAILSRVFLGEIISRRMMWTMGGVFVGMAIILAGSQKTAGAHWHGDLMAVGVAFCFASAMTALRKLRGRPTMPLLPVALLGSALVLAPFADIMGPVSAQWWLLLGHGAFITFASSLMTLGPRYITSAEVTLLILLESILAPILVWVLLGEDPGELTLVGGAVVIAVLLLSNLVVMWQLRRNRMLVR